jgi:hypothetical protein
MSGDVESSPGDVLQVEARYDDTEATILLGGEFDMTCVARFWGYLSAVLAPHPLSITVDASGPEFIDSSGLMALVRARDAAAEAGVGSGSAPHRPYFGASPSFVGSRICCGPSNSDVGPNQLFWFWTRAPRAAGPRGAQRGAPAIRIAACRSPGFRHGNHHHT